MEKGLVKETPHNELNTYYWEACTSSDARLLFTPIVCTHTGEQLIMERQTSFVMNIIKLGNSKPNND